MTRKPYLLLAALGVLLGVSILAIANLPSKWVMTIGAVGCFPLLLLLTRSLNKALLFLLIISLSMKMDFYLGYSEEYLQVRPGMPVSLTSIIIFLVYAVWSGRIVLRVDSVRYLPSVSIPFGVLVIWSSLSFLTASRLDYVLLQFPGVVTAFLVFFYAANTLKSPEDCLFIVKCLALGVALNSIVSIIQYASGSSLNLMFLGGTEALLEHEYSSVTITRVTGLLRNANDVAFFLNGFLPLLLFYGIAIRSLRLRILFMCSFALGLMVLVVTYTRAGWLAFAISLLIIGIFSFKQRPLAKQSTVANVILIGLIAMLIISPFAPRMLTRLTQDDSGAAVSRIHLARKALACVIDYPVMGVGLGNYWPVVSNHDPDPILDQNDRPLDVHNMFLYIAAELGLPAFGLFAWLSILVFKQGITATALKDGQMRCFALGMLAGLTGVYFNSMFENVSFGHSLFVILSFLWGCLVGLKEI